MQEARDAGRKSILLLVRLGGVLGDSKHLVEIGGGLHAPRLRFRVADRKADSNEVNVGYCRARGLSAFANVKATTMAGTFGANFDYKKQATSTGSSMSTVMKTYKTKKCLKLETLIRFMLVISSQLLLVSSW